MKRPPRPDHPLEYSADERTALLFLMAVCIIVVTIVHYWPAAPPEQLSPEEEAAYLAKIEDFVARSRAKSDSVAAAKAERQRAYDERQERWAANKARWAREREERQGRRDGYNNRRRGSAPATAIDYAVAMPALASLDANAVDSATLLRLGVPVAIAARWLKYRRSGGRFRKTGDIGKLYGLADTTATRLQAYFAPPASPPGHVADDERRSGAPGLATAAAAGYAPGGERATAVLDVNTATAEELEALRGIGAYTARKIVEYRGWLGGYVSVDQLLEARGVRAENLEGVRDRLTIGTAGPAERIRVNDAATYDEWRHPYVEWKKAKVIVAYREQHGPYAAPEDLLKTLVVTEEEVARLAPYLDFGT